MARGKKLTETEVKLLIEHYPSGDLKWLAEQLNRKQHCLSFLAKQHNLKRTPIMTEEHKKLIIDNYEYGNLDELAKLTGKNKHALHEWARKHNLSRKINTQRKGTLLPLLDNTHEAYYWLGMFASDGYISKDGHFMLSQGEKGKDQVYKLANFLQTNVYEYYSNGGYKDGLRATYRVNIFDKEIGIAIRTLFNIKDKKTYSPINLDFMKISDTKNTSFLIGLIDGDGCIYERSIKIECHLSWLQTFQDLKTKLPKEISDGLRVFIREHKKRNKAFSCITINAKTTRLLHKFINEYDLPASKIKWNRIKTK